MKRENLKRGFWGTGIFLAGAILLALTQSGLPYDSAARGVIHSILVFIATPPVFVWEKLLGVNGDRSLELIVPIFASIALYIAGIGFGLGILLNMSVRRKKH